MSLEYIVDIGLRRPRMNVRPFLLAAMCKIDTWDRRWLVRVWIGTIKATVAPLAARVVQACFKRHLRRGRAVVVIQNAAFRHLWRPGGWAERQSRREFVNEGALVEVQQSG